VTQKAEPFGVRPFHVFLSWISCFCYPPIPGKPL